MAHMIQFCSDPINLMILGSIYFNLRVSLQVWELIGVGAEQNHGRCSSQMQKDALKACQSSRFEFNMY